MFGTVIVWLPTFYRRTNPILQCHCEQCLPSFPHQAWVLLQQKDFFISRQTVQLAPMQVWKKRRLQTFGTGNGVDDSFQIGVLLMIMFSCWHVWNLIDTEVILQDLTKPQDASN